LGAVDLKDFLKHYIKSKKGKVINEKGEVIGYHDGVVFHTLGERHGFTITKKTSTDGAYYVIRKDIKKNILFVSQAPDVGRRGNFDVQRLERTNWISEVPKLNKNYTAQIRYHGEFLECKIVCESPTSARVIFNKPILVASGQSCVIYDRDVCLGGGIII
jgi:tRNA-specific 2-thiouridylase